MNQNNLELQPDSSTEYTLLTGATGLVGQYLMRDLLLGGTRLAVIVRPRKKESAWLRVERILQYWESTLGITLARPVIFSGDVAEPDLGFCSETTKWVADHCNSIIHNAAILRFNGSDRANEPWKTNLGGTQNVLDVSRRCQIANMHYVSTAYVSGNRKETILESDFDDSFGFRNDYERSKFAAEKLVRETNQFDTKTLYRPVVIAGDSSTGFTSSYHGLFVYLRLFSLFIPEQQRDKHGKILTHVKIPWEANQTRNVVTVDWVSSVFCELFNNPAAHGRTYHMSPDQGLTPAQVVDACYEYFDSFGAEFCGNETAADDLQNPEFAQKIFDSVAIYQQYESNDPEFDNRNLKQFAGHIHCPAIDTATIHRFLDFGNTHNWGKKPLLKIVRPDDDQQNSRLTA